MDNRPPPEADTRADPAAQLQRHYRDHELPQLVSDLEQQWRQALERGCRLDDLKELACLTHLLVGGSSGFGLTETAALARRIDDRLRTLVQDRRGPTGDEREAVSDDVAALRSVVSGMPAMPDPAPPATPRAPAPAAATAADKPRVYLVDDDPAQGHYLAIQLSAHGFDVRCFERLDALREAVLTHPPAALVADIVFPEGDSAGIEAVAALRHSTAHPLPVAFVSARHDAATRLAALRAGGIGYFTKPVAVPGLAARLREAVAADGPRPFRVLMVDDDRALLELHAQHLRAAGFLVRALTDPLALLDAALDFHPELILLDLYMPGADGLELSRLLRQEESLLDVPIVFLSGEKDPDRHLQAIAAGALDFLVKPVQPARLAELVRSRAGQYRRRAARIRYLGRTDPVTGLYDRHYFTALLNERHNQPGEGVSAVLFVELAGCAELCRSHPPEHCNLLRAKLAEAIRGRLTGDDVAASYSDSAFTVLARRQDPAGLEALAGELAQAVATTRIEVAGRGLAVTARVGIAPPGVTEARSALGKAAELAAQPRRERDVAPAPAPVEGEAAAVKSERHRHWLKEISGALKENRLLLVFQPITSLGADTVERYETLLRMKSGDGQMILPGQFMDIADELKLTRVLDRWVVRNALALLNRRQQDTPGTMFFVKLSRSSIQDDEFAGWLASLLAKYPVTAGSCVYEFSGDDLLADEQAAQRLLQALRALHFRTAVEHVGADERALRLMDSYPLDFLKLDRSLTHKLQEDRDKQARVKKLIDKTKERGIKTLAAYVEDANCLALLWQHRIDLIQGNLLRQPGEDLHFALDI